MSMDPLLLSFGVNIASSAIYDFIKSTLSSGITDKDHLQTKLASYLRIENANIVASKIIEFAAENGDISISNSRVHANNTVAMQSASNTSFIFGHNSVSSTINTKIETTGNASIRGSGGASIIQSDNGSIKFNA